MSLDQLQEKIREGQLSLAEYDQKVRGVAGALEEKLALSSLHPTRPGRANLDHVRGTGETALQRAIFNARETYLQTQAGKPVGTIIWVDLELPVVLSESARRPPVDLIGLIGESLCLCELKYAPDPKSYPSSSPACAVSQVLEYFALAHRFCDNLHDNNCYHQPQQLGARAIQFDWRSIRRGSPWLVVAANGAYWEYWRKKKTYASFRGTIASINKLISPGHLALYSLPEVSFADQTKPAPSSTRRSYMPYKPSLTAQQQKWEAVYRES